MGNNKVIFIIAAVIVIVGGASLLLITSKNSHSNTKKTSITTVTATKDPDTGDTIVNAPGKTPEYNNGDPTVVLGGDGLVNKVNMTDQQYLTIINTLKQYVKDHLGGKPAQTIKILPDTIKQTQYTQTESGTYEMQLKIEQPNASLDLTLYIVGIHGVRLVITNPAQTGVYDSGIIQVSDASSSN